ncbi:DUF4272 domain-containing protein [Brevundimonas sp. A19_0]|uniref:DUF4272 domain-containing protein n=1 Tax=Brevundimonas sp. A19_0 TaxID=2821087 RepID=UPI001ADC477A|nr:DUF4272 domain-containing protein [Brevundimonas sp. A19_0]MBO9500867.1 DUF4272 domain-containing protein [Brevundimonas sp. A19_0]
MTLRFDQEKTRRYSTRIAKAHGLDILPSLPFLDEPSLVSDAKSVVDRLLCLNAICAAAYGFPVERAQAWLDGEGLQPALTAEERAFLSGSNVRELFQTQVEGAWALAWALRLVPTLDPWVGADDGFVRLLPNLKTNESSRRIRDLAATLRATDEILAALDLSYCLHWGVRQATVAGLPTPAGLIEYVVVERRRALEWLFSDEEWDDLTLDT